MDFHSDSKSSLVVCRSHFPEQQILEEVRPGGALPAALILVQQTHDSIEGATIGANTNVTLKSDVEWHINVMNRRPQI